MIRTLHEGLLADGIRVSLVKLCACFGVPRRTVYYKPTKVAPKVDLRFAEPIKAMIEENPSFGYRTVAFLLGFNKSTVQRIFQLKNWQVRKRPIGMRPRIQALPSVATAPNERWSTDLCRIWAGKDGWTSLALVIDCHTRASRLASVSHRQGNHGRKRAGACPDQPLRHPRPRQPRVPVAVGQWPGLHQPPLHCPGPKLRPPAGVHHPALPAAERHGRARHPDFERAVRASPPLRKHPARNPRHQ